MYNTHPVLRSAVLGQNCADCMRDFTIDIIEGLRERTKHLYIFFFRPSLSGVLFPMFCLLVEGECQILVF